MITLAKAFETEGTKSKTMNGGNTYNTTLNGILDLFALGGAYRVRTDKDCILLFQKALAEDETLALKCLFYLRDVRGGQGERRFFRVCIKWLANHRPELIRRNMKKIPYYGRWDDLYALEGTSLEKEMFDFLHEQLMLDCSCTTPSLLAKWLKSCNASSEETKHLARKTYKSFNMTEKEYRQVLSNLRERIKVLERLMSQGRFDEIKFDKIPSKAGLKYRNAFARNDITREKYEKFIRNSNTKVNAEVLNPCDVVHKALKEFNGDSSLEREVINKYWDNLKNYFDNSMFNGLAVVDTSGSMGVSLARQVITPIDVAISLGMYCAEKCSKDSPWYGKYITFSRKARFVPIAGIDFVDKVRRIYEANLCENTNIASVFELILETAQKYHVPQEGMPQNIIIISDMEFDSYTYKSNSSVMEEVMRKWEESGYNIPHLIYWNVNAMQDNIPMRNINDITFVSGYSASLFQQVMSKKRGLDLVLDILNGDRYAMIF